MPKKFCKRSSKKIPSIFLSYTFSVSVYTLHCIFCFLHFTVVILAYWHSSYMLVQLLMLSIFSASFYFRICVASANKRSKFEKKNPNDFYSMGIITTTLEYYCEGLIVHKHLVYITFFLWTHSLSKICIAFIANSMMLRS
jgi:phage terminase large subunit-like protein